VAEGSKVQAERNSSNNASALDLPPVMPAELIKLRTSAVVSDLVDPYRQHFMKFWMADDIDEVENEHKKLPIAYSREPGVKAPFDTHDESAFFSVAWDSVNRRFKTLRQFCGSLATAFPNTTSAGGDFSLMKWEKDEHRMTLTSLS
jgi:hypothetical protein